MPISAATARFILFKSCKLNWLKFELKKIEGSLIKAEEIL